MLILARKKNETLELTVPPSEETQRITVMVTRVESGWRAWLGVKAPRHIQVDRGECLKQEQTQG